MVVLHFVSYMSSTGLQHAKKTVQAEWNKFNKLIGSQDGSTRHVQEYAQNMINEICRSIDTAAKHQRISNGDASPSSLREEVSMEYRWVGCNDSS